MAPRLRRLALRGVTYAGVPMPGATLDYWEDAQGPARWSVRLRTRMCPALDGGELAGETSSGQSVSGQVVIVDRQAGEAGRRDIVVVFRGVGLLDGLG
jgi:hypothetical protein